ncbi:hypothetical protein PCE1_000007 [Barthelona sp. PCE]
MNNAVTSRLFDVSSNNNISHRAERRLAFQSTVDRFLCFLRRRTTVSTAKLSEQTLGVLREFCNSFPFVITEDGDFSNKVSALDLQSLVAYIKRMGHEFEMAQPLEVIPANVVRNFLFRIRNLLHTDMSKDVSIGSSLNMSGSLPNIKKELFSTNNDVLQYEESFGALSNKLLSILNEVKEDELVCQDSEFSMSVYDSIAEKSDTTVSYGDVIMTAGHSETVLRFLESCSERNIHVVVVELSPTNSGSLMACRLRELKIGCTLVPDASVHILMSKISKVIIGAHAIDCTGGILSNSGVMNICASAELKSVPVVVVGASIKLTPTFVQSHFQKNSILSPSSIVNPEDEKIFANIEAIHSSYDFVPPKYITLYVTNDPSDFCFGPTDVYRKMASIYHFDDWDLARV